MFAVPGLLRRILAELSCPVEHHIHRPIRSTRNRLPKPGELEKAVELAITKTGPRLPYVLVLLDSDDDCPRNEAPALLARIRNARPNLQCAMAFAHHEFENWFLASAMSLRGCCGLPDNLKPPDDPESIRGAKQWLSNQMPDRGCYSPTVDQPALAAQMNLKEARSAPSFDKLWREMERLVQSARLP